MGKQIIPIDEAERVLANAKTIDQAREAHSWYKGIRALARAISDDDDRRKAEITAADFEIRARRRLGKLIEAASKAGQLAKGARGKPGPGRGKRGVKKPRVLESTLEGAGVDKNLAKAARQLARIDDEEFEDRREAWHHSLNGGGNARVTLILPRLTPKAERAASRVRANNISLKEWDAMSADEQREFLQPHNFPSNVTFNKQESAGIEWAQHSWNPIVGCKHDCPYCYARDIAEHYPDAFPHRFEPAFRPYMLNAPANSTVPGDATFDTRFKNVFTGSMTDIFGRWVPREWIEAVLDQVRSNAQWNFLFLTKFPKRMAEFNIPANAWMGTTVDLQARVANAEAAFAKLNKEAGIRWLSVEPMLEPLKFKQLDLFNWIVIGGASKSSKTPAFHPPLPWIIDLYEQAKAAGCAVYMKTNLLGERVLELPFDAPIEAGPKTAPKVFNYLGKGIGE